MYQQDDSINVRFRAAVKALENSTKSVQQRLVNACVYILPINAYELPVEIQADFIDFGERLSHVEDTKLESLVATIQQISEAEATELAQAIVQMLAVLSTYYDDNVD